MERDVLVKTSDVCIRSTYEFSVICGDKRSGVSFDADSQGSSIRAEDASQGCKLYINWKTYL